MAVITPVSPKRKSFSRPAGRQMTRSVAPYEEFEPALFPGLKFNLAALIDESKTVVAEENNDE